MKRAHSQLRRPHRNESRPERPLPRVLFAYAALTPLIMIPLPIGQSIGAVDILFPVAVFTLLRLRWTRFRGVANWFLAFAIASALATVVVIGVSEQLGNPVFIVRMFAIYAPLLILLSDRRIQPDRLRTLAGLILCSTTFASVIAIAMHAAGIQVRENQQRLWEGGVSSLRAGGIWGNSADLGHVAAILGVLACTVGFVYLRRRWLALCLIALAVYVMFISSSRAALLHLLVVVIIMLPVYFHRRIFVVLFGAPLALIAGITLSNSMAGTSDWGATFKRFDVFNLTGQSEFFAATSRLSSWDRLLEQLREQPLVGIGYGNAEGTSGAGDNSFLSVVGETGLIAGIAYIAVWITLLVTALRLRDRAGRYVALALVIGEIMHMVTVDTHRMWASTALSLMSIGIALLLARSRDPEDDAHMFAIPPTRRRHSHPWRVS